MWPLQMRIEFSCFCQGLGSLVDFAAAQLNQPESEEGIRKVRRSTDSAPEDSLRLGQIAALHGISSSVEQLNDCCWVSGGLGQACTVSESHCNKQQQCGTANGATPIHS